MEKQDATQTRGIGGARKPHLALYPSIGLGHLIPFVGLASKIVACCGFSVTFITTKWNVTYRLQTAYLEALVSSNSEIRLWELPDGAPEETPSNLFAYIEKSMGTLEDRLKILVEPRDSWPPICALVTDLFHASALDVCKKIGLPAYTFFTSSAAFLCLMLYTPKLVTQESFLDDVNTVFHIPGIQPSLSRRELPASLSNMSSSICNMFMRMCSGLQGAAGILVNTFYELESHSLDALRSGRVLERHETPPVYPIGPILLAGPADANKVPGVKGESECLEWLDDQPEASVVYVSLGSWGFMSSEETAELALGLEGSRQRFLWILRGVRPPTGMFPSTEEADLEAILPEGFRCRVKDRGLVLSSWAPQIAILSHRSVGGFVCHCGWNSTLEGIWCGVPMVAWPFHSEQQLHSVLLVNEWKIGLAVSKEEDGMVRKEEVERVTRKLMEGDEGRLARTKVKELRKFARDAIAEKEGSSAQCFNTATLNVIASKS